MPQPRNAAPAAAIATAHARAARRPAQRVCIPIPASSTIGSRMCTTSHGMRSLAQEKIARPSAALHTR